MPVGDSVGRVVPEINFIDGAQVERYEGWGSGRGDLVLGNGEEEGAGVGKELFRRELDHFGGGVVGDELGLGEISVEVVWQGRGEGEGNVGKL